MTGDFYIINFIKKIMNCFTDRKKIQSVKQHNTNFRRRQLIFKFILKYKYNL